MTLLNRLFGKRKKIAQELAFDEEKRMKLWQEHLENFKKREQLCKFFNYGNANNALNDYPKLELVLNQISALISEDFVHIKDDQKTEKEIAVDLEFFNSHPHKRELENLNSSMVYDRITKKSVKMLFQKIFAVLQLEMQTIQLVRNRKLDIKQSLLHLFELIYFREATLLKMFYEKFIGIKLCQDIKK